MDVYYEYDRGMIYTQEYLRDFQNGMSLFKDYPLAVYTVVKALQTLCDTLTMGNKTKCFMYLNGQLSNIRTVTVCFALLAQYLTFILLYINMHKVSARFCT